MKELVWERDPDGVDDTWQVAKSGNVIIGSVRRSDTTGKWWWEMVSLPGRDNTLLDRRGRSETGEIEAKKIVSSSWSQWVREAGLL